MADFPHLNAAGDARMVDVSDKSVTVRTATAAGRVLLSAECVAALRDGSVPKGDALAVARIAGIQGAKKTPDLIPLCHPLPLTGVDVVTEVTDAGVEITATVKTAGRTGVEMEALTAVSVAGLAVIDMIKAIVVGDDAEELKQLINDQLIRADLILTTGGVSQGDFDIVKAVMPEMGECDFAQVAMQPGKPQGFGLIGDDLIPMIMLPGNPVSAFVSFEAFVRPVIRKLMGVRPYVRTAVKCQAAHAMTSISGRRQFARGIVSATGGGGRQVELVGGHGSHLLGDLARANALVILAEDVEFVAAGEHLDVGRWTIRRA